MTAATTAYQSAEFIGAQPAQRKSWVHWLALAFVAVTIASSGIVFSEPAPVDALTIGLIVLLPTVGLVAFNQTLLAYFSLWSLAGACAVFAATFSLDMRVTLTHVGVTLYLYLASVVFAGFVAKSPARHTELIFKAWTWAAVVAALAALIGYFALLPGTYDLFTKFDRASGTFKDPNVLGPFLIAPILYLLHVALQRSFLRMIVPLAVMGLLSLAVLLTFSRGAWMNLAVAFAVYGYLALLTSKRASTRLKLAALLCAGALFAVTLVAVALTSDSISNMFMERANLAMSYDVGPEGRFGGQEKAVGLIAEHPLGIGAQEFATRHHSEEVHNVYLSVLLDAGWLGGGIYWIMVGLTLALGFRHAMKDTATRPLFLVAYAAFVGVALEGAIVDTDHWRHFYLLMAIIWGLMSASPGARAATDALPHVAGLMRRRPRVPAMSPRTALPAMRRRPPGIVWRVRGFSG
jgi:Ca2+/Na+ antiporter